MEEYVDAVGVRGCGCRSRLREWVGYDEGAHEILMDELSYALSLQEVVVKCTGFDRNKLEYGLLLGK